MYNKVAVILSTYNGEKYIKEQIESIMEQSFKNFDLFIHDDGSNDTTPKIIKAFADRYENIHIIVEKRKLGYPKCFIEMLKMVENYRFYAFCDQDDVWNKKKLANGVNALCTLNEKKPLLYYLSLTDVLFGGEAMGMTFMFNDVSRNALIKANENGSFKDWFLKIYCSACGDTIYDPEPSAMYRRHDEAVTGESNPSGKIKRYCSQIKEIFFSKNTFNEQKKIITLLKKEYFDEISREDQRLLELFSTSDSAINRMKKVFYKKRFRRKILDELGYRLAFLLGKI